MYHGENLHPLRNILQNRLDIFTYILFTHLYLNPLTVLYALNQCTLHNLSLSLLLQPVQVRVHCACAMRAYSIMQCSLKIYKTQA